MKKVLFGILASTLLSTAVYAEGSRKKKKTKKVAKTEQCDPSKCPKATAKCDPTDCVPMPGCSKK